MKPWLLLQELRAGSPEALWLDADMIVTRPVSALVKKFPAGELIVAEEWDSVTAADIAHWWDVPPVRPVTPVNSCFVRVNQSHLPLLERWLEGTQSPRYRAAQTLPFEQRPWHLSGDQVLLTAVLGTAQFSETPVNSIRVGRDIAQCAGSSGYGPMDRMRGLFTGLPALIHCIGRKPWEPIHETGPRRFMLDLATDVSPYVLAARKTAGSLDMFPAWVAPRTAPGAVLRRVTGSHPGLAGLPLAVLMLSRAKSVTPSDLSASAPANPSSR